MMIAISMYERGATPGLLKKLWNKLAKACWSEVAIHWHKEMRPKHFTHAGAREYGYDKRQGEGGIGRHDDWRALGAGASFTDRMGRRAFYRTYTGRKLQRFGHTYPLVWSGASRTLTGMRNISATKSGSRVTMNAPTLNFRKGKTGTGKTMREEMTTVSSGERVVIAGVWDRAFQSGIEGVREESAKHLFGMAMRGR
jgi:hypothetical protein